MNFIINISIGFMMIFAVIINNRTATKANGNILLGSTLPASHLQDEDVLSIIKEYKKSNIIFMSLAAVCNFFAGFLELSTSIIFMFLWVTALIYINGIVFRKYFNKIQELKRKNDWFIINKHIIKVDTEVSRLKDKMPIAKLWFLPALIINFISLGITISYERELGSLIITMSSFICFILFFIIYNLYSKGATKVYSKDSEINIACNYVYRRVWSINFLLAATLISVTSIISILDISLSLPITIITSIIMVLAIVMGDRKIKSTQNKLINISESDIYYVDDDKYWGAFIYSNPNDPKVFVEKRTGIGSTINMGNPTAKKIAIGFTIFILIIISGTLGTTIFMSSINFTVNMDETKVTIDVPLYGTEFNINDIEDVSEVDKLSKGVRTNGTETDDYALGHYKLDKYGKSRVYVFKNQPKEQYIFLTANTEEETEEYFNKLLNIK